MKNMKDIKYMKKSKLNSVQMKYPVVKLYTVQKLSSKSQE